MLNDLLGQNEEYRDKFQNRPELSSNSQKDSSSAVSHEQVP